MAEEELKALLLPLKTQVRSGIIPRMRGEGFDALALPYKAG